MAEENGPAPNGRWQKWTAIITASIAVAVFTVGMLWKVFIVSSAVDTGEARNGEIMRRLSDVEARLAKLDQDQTSARVTDLQRRLAALEDRVAKNDLDLNSMRRDFIEIETQFCEEDNVRNVTHAGDLRLMAVLFEKLFGTPYPVANAFYGRIGKCQTPDK
jgi:hypothetical protein